MEKQNKTDTNLIDKAFSRLLLTSVLGILVCIACLCSTTYAWFTGNVKNDNNRLQTASECLLSVSICELGSDEVIATVDTQNDVTLDGMEGSYTVTLTLPSGSASGYLMISTDEESYYTDYLQRNAEADGTLTFTLNVETAQSVTFTARWGIRSDACHVQNGEELTIN